MKINLLLSKSVVDLQPIYNFKNIIMKNISITAYPIDGRSQTVSYENVEDVKHSFDGYALDEMRIEVNLKNQNDVRELRRYLVFAEGCLSKEVRIIQDPDEKAPIQFPMDMMPVKEIIDHKDKIKLEFERMVEAFEKTHPSSNISVIYKEGKYHIGCDIDLGRIKRDIQDAEYIKISVKQGLETKEITIPKKSVIGVKVYKDGKEKQFWQDSIGIVNHFKDQVDKIGTGKGYKTP